MFLWCISTIVPISCNRVKKGWRSKTKQRVQTKIVWVPGHTDMDGNELTEVLRKQLIVQVIDAQCKAQISNGFISNNISLGYPPSTKYSHLGICYVQSQKYKSMTFNEGKCVMSFVTNMLHSFPPPCTLSHFKSVSWQCYGQNVLTKKQYINMD